MSFDLRVEICNILSEMGGPDEIIISDEISPNDAPDLLVCIFNHAVAGGGVRIGGDKSNAVGDTRSEEYALVELTIRLNDMRDGVVRIHDILEVSPHSRQPLVSHSARKYLTAEVINHR